MAIPEIERVIQPARHLDLVLAASEKEYQIEVRSTIIYEIFPENDSFIAAQTQPPILKSMIGETIEATFLWYPTPTSSPERYAFYTKILELLDYTLSPGHQTQALRLSYPKYFYKRNLRFFYRVTPVKEYPITLYINKEVFPIIDISEGGICFSYPKKTYLEEFKVGDRFRLVLEFGNEEKKLKPLVEVVRKFEKKEFPKIAFMAVKFIDLNTSEREFLASVIKKIERILLRKRAGLG